MSKWHWWMDVDEVAKRDAADPLSRRVRWHKVTIQEPTGDEAEHHATMGPDESGYYRKEMWTRRKQFSEEEEVAMALLRPPPEMMREILTAALEKTKPGYVPTPEDVREEERRAIARRIEAETEDALAKIRAEQEKVSIEEGTPFTTSELEWYSTSRKLPRKGQQTYIRLSGGCYAVAFFGSSQMLPNSPLPYSWRSGAMEYWGHQVTHWAEIREIL